STQLGQVVGVSLEIYEFSTPQDRQVLVEAYEKGQNNGLVTALSKMKAVGHCSITGTLGYDVSFIRMIPTPTGRNIRFITNRLLRFGSIRRHPIPILQPDRRRIRSQRHRQAQEHRRPLSRLPTGHGQRGKDSVPAQSESLETG